MLSLDANFQTTLKKGDTKIRYVVTIATSLIASPYTTGYYRISNEFFDISTTPIYGWLKIENYQLHRH